VPASLKSSQCHGVIPLMRALWTVFNDQATGAVAARLGAAGQHHAGGVERLHLGQRPEAGRCQTKSRGKHSGHVRASRYGCQRGGRECNRYAGRNRESVSRPRARSVSESSALSESCAECGVHRRTPRILNAIDNCGPGRAANCKVCRLCHHLRANVDGARALANDRAKDRAKDRGGRSAANGEIKHVSQSGLRPCWRLRWRARAGSSAQDPLLGGLLGGAAGAIIGGRGGGGRGAAIAPSSANTGAIIARKASGAAPTTTGATAAYVQRPTGRGSACAGLLRSVAYAPHPRRLAGCCQRVDYCAQRYRLRSASGTISVRRPAAPLPVTARRRLR